jgi:hypothetical protein
MPHPGRDRPVAENSVPGRNLRGHVQSLATVRPDHIANDPLALPIAASGVNEVDTKLDRPLQSPDRLVLLGPDPGATTNAPGAVTDLGDRQPRTTQLAVLHRSSSSGRTPCHLPSCCLMDHETGGRGPCPATIAEHASRHRTRQRQGMSARPSVTASIGLTLDRHTKRCQPASRLIVALGLVAHHGPCSAAAVAPCAGINVRWQSGGRL